MPGVLTHIETTEKLSIIEYVEMEKVNSIQVDDNKWGFQITGGTKFGMPITVFHVNSHSFMNKILAKSLHFTLTLLSPFFVRLRIISFYLFVV